jgi:predicted glycoside hydrolase/deacetylase ChbG (UPF0249 family)
LTPLLVCADDFAIHDAATDGIVHLIDKGRITATSAMTWSPWWPAHAQRVRAHQHRFDMGLHLDASSEFARSRGAPGLVQLMLASQSRVLRASICGAWIKSQLDAFEDAWQATPDHVDGHQHIQQFPVMRDELLNELARRYSDVPFLRLSRPVSLGFDLKAVMIGAMGAGPFSREIKQRGVPHNEWLTGLYDFNPSPGQYPKVMRQCLAALPGKTILMCHPARVAVEGDEIGDARFMEFGYLASDEFIEDLKRFDIHLVRARDLCAPRAA